MCCVFTYGSIFQEVDIIKCNKCNPAKRGLRSINEIRYTNLFLRLYHKKYLIHVKQKVG